MCDCDEISTMEDVKEWLSMVRTLFNKTNESAKSLDAEHYIKDFNDDFKEFLILLSNIEEKVSWRLCLSPNRWLMYWEMKSFTN